MFKKNRDERKLELKELKENIVVHFKDKNQKEMVEVIKHLNYLIAIEDIYKNRQEEILPADVQAYSTLYTEVTTICKQILKK